MNPEYDPSAREFLIAHKACDLIEELQDGEIYDVLIKDFDYTVNGRIYNADILIMDTENRAIEVYNYPVDSLPESWDEFDIPEDNKEEFSGLIYFLNSKLGQDEERNGKWSYVLHERRVNRNLVDRDGRIDGDIYMSGTVHPDNLGEFFETLTGNPDSWKELEEIDPEQCH